MSLQATYLINGNWASRPVDIREVMETNTRPAQPLPSNTARCRPPATGLLSRTIMPSPVIHWILPARLRQEDKNDIVFVGENFIQIKELVPGGHLEDIITKSDFDTKILAAKVIGSVPSILEIQLRQGTGGTPEKRPEDGYPPQILVLVLDSKELLFLYTEAGQSGRLEFTHVRRPLPADVSSLEDYGRHIAVDPSSRAIAVSAAQKFFGIFSLKSPDDIKSGMKTGPVNPIHEERFFRTDGDIVAMEFLHPATGDENRVILVMLVSHLSRTHIVCYNWKASEGVGKIEGKKLKSRLPSECQIPLLFIPLTAGPCFLLVTPTSFNPYEINLADNTALAKPRMRDHVAGSHDTWTSWVRPRRHSNHNEKEDDIYLCNQDGRMLYLTINKDTRDVTSNHQIDPIGCKVDTGFAIVDKGFGSTGDFLVAAGSMSDGGLFLLPARKSTRCLQRIPNWAPVFDSVVIKAPYSGSGENNPKNENGDLDFAFDRIFACSGNNLDRGSITELRHGLEARVGWMIDQEDSGVLDVWAAPNLQTGGTFFLFSNPVSSSVISVPTDPAEDPYAMNDEEIGLNFDIQTISAGASQEGVIIQVTGSSIHLSAPQNPSLRFSTQCQGPNERIIAAAVKGSYSLFAVAVRTEDNIHIHLRKVEISDNGLQCPSVGQPLPLTCEPISLTIEQVNSCPVLFIGASDGKVLVARIDLNQGLVPSSEQEISLPSGNNESKACEAFTMLSVSQHGRAKTSLFCGLRSGYVVSFSVHFDDVSGTIGLTQTGSRKLGDTSIRIRRYESDPTFGIVTCGRGFWRLSHIEDENSEQFVLDKIWFTDQNNPGRMQSSVDVFTCVDSHPDPHQGALGGSLVCITKNQLLCCTLDKTPKTVPRQIILPGSPGRIIYSEYLKRLVVSYNVVEMESTPECTKRWIRPRIDFIDPDCEIFIPSSPVDVGDDPENISDPQPKPQRPTGASGEIVKAILDWTVTHGEHAYHMLAVGTKQPHSTNRGRMIYIIARPNAQHPAHIDAVEKYIHTYNDPVRSIAAFKPSSLVLAIGRDLIFQTYDPRKKFVKLPPYRLESDAVAVSVKEPYIYVLTVNNSLCILQVTDGSLTLHAQDGSDRTGLDLVNLQTDSQITMTSNLGGAIIGLSEIGLTPEEKLLQQVFAAHMPLYPIRLCRSTRPAIPGVSEVVYGTTIGGTVYRFTTISEKEWRLLKYIQNLCIKDPLVCPLARRRRRSKQDAWDVTISKPSSLHVDGDILSRLAERGIGHLRLLVGAEDMDEGGRGAEKLAKFREYAAAVVPDAEDPFAAVATWMGWLLQVSL
ncbi:hypothetical protein FQN51_003444 [Onygenales sp. PD_10]|nr:hypothetical protein FQN51_003444 [Onygenales sp. PD_10]